jgi:hypothetical protein
MAGKDATEGRVFRVRQVAGWPVLLGLLLGCGGGPPPPSSNHAPSLGPTAEKSSLLAGQSTALSTNATDPDGDALSYSWAQTSPASPQGTFSSETSGTPTWTAPAVAAFTPFILTVTVSDGHGHSPSKTVTVYGKTPTDPPSFVADVQPFLVHCFGACHTTAEGLQPLSWYDTLVTNPPNDLPYCTAGKLVVPGDPNNSVLIKTMIGSSCGPEMPAGGPYLSPDQFEMVRAWISQGAANN